MISHLCGRVTGIAHVRPHHALGTRAPVLEKLLVKPQIGGPDAVGYTYRLEIFALARQCSGQLSVRTKKMASIRSVHPS